MIYSFSCIAFLCIRTNKKKPQSLYPVVIQLYEAEADNEYVIRGNPAVMKCEIPSYVADFVSVDLWMDSNGGTYYPGDDTAGTYIRLKNAMLFLKIIHFSLYGPFFSLCFTFS